MFRIRFDFRLFCIFIFLVFPALAAAQNSLFTAILPNATGAAPTQVTTSDFNGDGIMDMAVTVPSQNVVDVFIGTGDGNFGAAVSYAAGTNPIAIVAGDFNHDGHVDLAVANALGNGQASILFGKGDGTFVTGGSYFAGLVPFTIGVGDFDGDGNLDLAVVDFGQGSTPGSVTILLGRSDGSFQTVNNYTVGASPVTIAVGDFTGDGKPDLAVGFDGAIGASQSQVVILTNVGGGSFQSGALLTALVSGGVQSVTAADFDGDGRLDLAAVSVFSSRVALFHGNGNGTFDAVSASPSVGQAPFWIAAADINGDGSTDLVTANGVGTVSILLGNGDTTFTTQTTYPAGNQPVALALADLNGDGKLDATVVDGGGNDVQVLLGRGDGTFSAGTTFQVGANAGGIATGDFNGDGFADLAVTKGDGTAAIFLGDGRGGFTALNPFPACQFTGGLPGRIAAADVNGDGKVDLAILCNITSPTPGFSIGVFKGNGDGTFVNLFSTGNGNLSGVIAADINGDGIPEFVIASDRGILAVNLDTNFFDIILSNVSVQDVAAGDFNGDGKTDLLAIGSGIFPGFVFLGDGTGNFQQVPHFDWNGGLTGDFNGDGFTDFLNYQPNDLVQVILNQGNATFLQGSEVQGNPLGSPQSLADFDGDGVLDLLTAFHSGAPLNVFLGHEDGTFDPQPAVSLSQLGNATVAVADFDNNGSPDVAALDPTTGTVSILLNKNSFHPTTTMLSAQGKVVAGGPIAFSAAVASKQDTPTGSVTFKQAGVPQTISSLNNGTALATLSAPFTAGTYGFTALYTGDGTFGGSLSQRLLVNVSAASSTTVVTSSKKNSNLGQSVTLTATVTPQYSGVPTGTVAFYSDGQPIGSGTMSNGQASVSISSLTEGRHTIEADYSGDASFVTSVGLLTQRVGTASSTVTLASSFNPAVYGQPVTLTATVTDSEGVAPTGQVVFSEAGAIYGSVTLSAGVAQVTLPQLLVGKHTITAQYSGDSTDDPSKANLTETIQGAPSATAITSNLNPSNFGQAVIFTATVTSAVGTPGGTVTFNNGNQGLGTVTLSGGQAQLSVTTIDAGARTIKAIYNGSSTYAASQNSLQQVVVAAPTTLTLTGSPNPASSGQVVTFTATVGCASAVPTGTVTFKDGKTVLNTASVINGQAQFTTPTLTTGTHSMTVTFKGSADFAASTSPKLQEVIN